ncbi:MAG: hypothetical protein QM533_03710 [Cytophagales bacterium]|nr:hypothetical protein [Cytophagales bacterium]
MKQLQRWMKANFGFALFLVPKSSVMVSHDPANFYMPRVERWWLPLHL